MPKNNDEKSRYRSCLKRVGDGVRPIIKAILKNVSEFLTEIII